MNYEERSIMGLGFIAGLLIMISIMLATTTSDNTLVERDLAYYDAKSGRLILKDLSKGK